MYSILLDTSFDVEYGSILTISIINILFKKASVSFFKYCITYVSIVLGLQYNS